MATHSMTDPLFHRAKWTAHDRKILVEEAARGGDWVRRVSLSLGRTENAVTQEAYNLIKRGGTPEGFRQSFYVARAARLSPGKRRAYRRSLRPQPAPESATPVPVHSAPERTESPRALIENREATIRTAAIEIKSLVVTGKQVTLAVFRQLPEDDVIDRDTGELCGTPWGRVNYHWGQMDTKCIHVVWQKGDVLYRSLVEKSRPNDPGDRWECSETSDKINALVDEYWRAHVVEWATPPVAEDGAFVFAHGAWRYSRAIDRLSEDIRAWVRWHDPANRDNQPHELLRYNSNTRQREIDRMETAQEVEERRAERKEQTLRSVNSPYGNPKPRSIPIILEELTILSDEWKEAERTRREKNTQYEQSYAALCALDQLFIAV